jgi:hypothetical protein
MDVGKRGTVGIVDRPSGAILPDDTKYTSETEPAAADPEPQDAENQPDQPGDLDAGGDSIA